MTPAAARTLTLAERRAVATCLRAADQALAGASVLNRSSPRNAALLLDRAVGWLTDAVLVSEAGIAALARRDAATAALDPSNPLQPALLARRSSARQHGEDRLQSDGRLPAAPDPDRLAADLAELRALIAQAARGYDVDLADPDSPAGRATPLRPDPPKPRSPPVQPTPTPPPTRRPAVIVSTAPKPSTPPAAPPRAVPQGEIIAPRRAGPVGAAPFWSLADRWKLADLEALALIGHAGGLTKKGTRPRFRLAGDEAARFGVLQEIDATLTAAGLDAGAWLRAGQAGSTPLERLGAGLSGAREVLRSAVQEGLRLSVGHGQGRPKASPLDTTKA